MRAFLAALLLVCSAVASFAQGTTPGLLQPGQIGANYSASPGLAAPNNWMASGTSCPAWLSSGQLFLNTSGSPTSNLLGVWDGAQCVTMGTLNATTHVFTPVGGSGSVTITAGSTPTSGFTANHLISSEASNVTGDSGVAASAGNITVGAWQATPVGVAYGGTGLTSLGTGVTAALGTAVDANGGIAIYGTASTAINGTACVVGSSCTVPAVASSFTPGTTTILGATAPCALVNTATTVSGCISLTNSYLAAGSFTNITGVGTLTTGTWNAAIIGAAYGGTGVNNSAATGVAQWNLGVMSASAALANGTTATTQTTGPCDSSTKVATDAFVVACVGGVTSVSANDTSLTISPTTGLVKAALNPANANTWAAVQTFPANDLVLSGVTGSIQCLHASATGVVTGSGSDCGAGSVTSVTNSDGTLTFTGTTAVVGSLALAHANTWAAVQTFPANDLVLSGVTGSTQCLQASTTGVVTGTGAACGGGSGTPTYAITTFTSSGTFTTASNSSTATIYHYRMVGGGGSGSGQGTAYGGGGGEYAEGTFTGVAASTGITITVGGGGAASSAGSAGTAGTASSIGTPVSVTAAAGGGGTNTTTTNNAGTGGTGTAAIRIPGQAGVWSSFTSPTYQGLGGSSHLGSNGYQSGSTVNGSSGQNYGAGGNSAATSSNGGGAGAPGIVIIERVAG